MSRIVGWEKRLKAVVEKHMQLPSQFGVSDCYLLPDDAVEAITGERMYPDIAYSTEQGAAKLLLQRGFKTVEDAFGAKFSSVHPFHAQRGDIGIVENNGELCGGFFSSVGFVARGTDKILFLPVTRVKSAFMVAR